MNKPNSASLTPSGSTYSGPVPANNASNAPSASTALSPREYEPAWLNLTPNQKERRAAADQFLYRSEVQKLEYARQGTVHKLVLELRARQYDALEKHLNGVNAEFFKDAANEFGYRDVIWGFAGCETVDLSLEKYFQAWAAARPRSAWSHLSLGMYYQAEGCSARGEGWGSEVTENQSQIMDNYLAEAMPELLKAQSLNSKLPPLYWTLIIHAKMTNDLEGATKAMDEAKKYAPTSYLAAVQYMDVLSPRWLGSYDQMDAFAQSMLTYLDKNPRYWDLQGYSRSEQGDDAVRENDYVTALEDYEVALSYADYRDWLLSAGESAQNIGRYGDALAFYMRNARYEKPLNSDHKSLEDMMVNACKLIPESCKQDPRTYPWFGEPGAHDPADDNPLK